MTLFLGSLIRIHSLLIKREGNIWNITGLIRWMTTRIQSKA